MTNEIFATNLMKMLAAELHFQSTLLVAREMYGRGYFALGVGERAVVDQTVFGHVASNYTAITPEFLAGQASTQPMGFGIHKATSEAKSEPSGGAS